MILFENSRSSHTFKINLRNVKSHLFTDNVVQIWNTDIRFNQRDLVHLLREGSLLDIVLDSHSIVGCWATLGYKRLLCTEQRDGQGTAFIDTEGGLPQEDSSMPS